MASLGIFEKRFGKDPSEFSTTHEIVEYVEKAIGHRMPVVYDRGARKGQVSGDINVDSLIFKYSCNDWPM